MPTSLNSGSRPNVRASSGMIGTIRGPSSGSRIRLRSSRAKTIVVLTGGRAAGGELGVNRGLDTGEELGPDDPLGQGAAQLAAPLAEVFDLFGLRAGMVVRRFLELRVGDRQLEPVAEDVELLLRELLGLVGDVAGLDARAQGPALDRVDQDRGRAAGELGRGLVRRVDLAVVVATAAELGQVVVGQVLDELAPGGDRARRNAPGYTPRPRPSTSGTRRRGCRSSC